jgi:hypothetical protein
MTDRRGPHHCVGEAKTTLGGAPRNERAHPEYPDAKGHCRGAHRRRFRLRHELGWHRFRVTERRDRDQLGYTFGLFERIDKRFELWPNEWAVRGCIFERIVGNELRPQLRGELRAIGFLERVGTKWRRELGWRLQLKWRLWIERCCGFRIRGHRTV